MSEDIHKWSDGRYVLMFDEHTFFVFDNEKDDRMTALETTERLNMQQATIQELERKVKKYAKIGEEQLKQIIELQETETFTFPPNCDECDFLGNNGICGYCKFTLNCYDSKEDLIDGKILPNCPLKPLINVLNEQQSTIRKLQDLCGESDSENAKLRIENKKLQEENEQLRDYIDTIFEDNTHICKDLDIEDVKFYCDKNKDYRSPSCLYQKCFDEENLIKIKDEIMRVFE